ncbi:hypothetical protein L486_08123 [Kwoniella mangroviensis CBS 10435]|uniref:Phosphoglycerate dehydrogenase n=1 Tax=Kwoniella mangroviensis CBS 10435 TaxID=1331196 RepID=A0A1B9IFK1_9TREE|nr:uncharacterized protein I203_07765 [Kwoniella mangroviensis CBS 8507]OCF54211.1 hypothetical protein L486_08123 [Kwoniella mangroviensis CBS 10435]OCF63031.1 hypothetical protein I203_07765 [Kwoniella mangroviensis CBS 8507]
MTKPIVVALNPLHPQALALATEHFDLILPSSERFKDWRRHAQGVLTISRSVAKEDVDVVREYGKLKYVAKQGTGVDMLDLKALKDAGIVVMNTPGINAQAVAELALGLIIDVARKISTTHARFYAGEEIHKADGWGGQTLFGKTIGLIGGGDTGFALARMFQSAFNGHVILYDPFLSTADLQRWERDIPPTFITRTSSFNDLLTQSDIVSLHCPLTKDTKGMISAPQFDLMKRTAVLVNVARGGVVDEVDLEVALKEGKIIGAGVDVTVVEPPSQERYEGLCKAGCVITPHYGAAPADVQEATCLAMVEHMIEALRGGSVKNRVV